jgi:predicted ATPase
LHNSINREHDLSMKIRTLNLKNWMNYQGFKSDEFQDRMFIIGPNASGKSNFLDALRFLRDVALPAGVKPSGGGLQKAVNDRGGLSKLRCLNAKQDTEVLLEVELEDDEGNSWVYRLGFKGEGKANNRIVVTQEYVEKDGAEVLSRPDDDDDDDPERLTQTFLELTNANAKFRPLSRFFSETVYLHLVPQLLKFANLIGGNTIENDPFGQGFLLRVSATGEKTRDARLRRIQRALDAVVPQFNDLRFKQDAVTGQPHIEANFSHWRLAGAWQRESQFSDGTLRLIGLLWSLMEGSSLLLLEEPELSLNEEIVRHLPRLIQKIQKSAKSSRQILITTHSEAMLSDLSIPAEEVIRLALDSKGTHVKPLDEEEKIMLASGLSVGEVLLRSIKPQNIKQLNISLV